MDSTNPFLSYLFASFIFSTISLILLPRLRLKILESFASRFSWSVVRSRRSDDSQTPPRSMTPPSEKKASALPDLSDKFPPSTWPILIKGATSHSDLNKLKSDDIDDVQLKQRLIGFTESYKEVDSSKYTPMGVSIEDIRALGDFPNYSALSEVPLPNEYKGFDISRAIPRPYRPFRWAYHQTMSLSNLEPDWWLELEKTYVERIHEREELYRKYSKLVLQYLPGSELGCKEVMEHALQFLCARYPQYFALVHEAGQRGWVFQNNLLKNETVIKDMHPLFVLLHNVPEDFAVMVRNPADGFYYFRAGLLCSSLGWNVDTKIGMMLRDIHGPIPDYAEKMAMSMDRYFSKMPTSKPIQRGSWGLEIDTPLFMPPGDPHEKYRDYQLPELTLDRVHLRVDWQTLRRLPLSGCIIFNFKALFTPLEEFRTEPGVPKLVKKVLTEGKQSIMEYKNTWHVEHVALPALERWATEQEEWAEQGKDGYTPEGEGGREWDAQTLEDSPWFKGWREKWRGQQGF